MLLCAIMLNFDEQYYNECTITLHLALTFYRHIAAFVVHMAPIVIKSLPVLSLLPKMMSTIGNLTLSI